MLTFYHFSDKFANVHRLADWDRQKNYPFYGDIIILVGNAIRSVDSFRFVCCKQWNAWRFSGQSAVFDSQQSSLRNNKYTWNLTLTHSLRITWNSQFNSIFFICAILVFCAGYYFFAVVSYKTLKNMLRENRTDSSQFDVSYAVPVQSYGHLIQVDYIWQKDSTIHFYTIIRHGNDWVN